MIRRRQRALRGRRCLVVVEAACLTRRKAVKACLPQTAYTLSKAEVTDVVDATVIITPIVVVHPILLTTKRNKRKEEFIRDRRLVVIGNE